MAAPQLDDFLEHFRLRVTVDGDRTEEQVVLRNKKHIRVWKRLQWLGEGAYGKVWLEQSRSKGCRAVKRVEKCKQRHQLKEIRALAKFSKVRS